VHPHQLLRRSFVAPRDEIDELAVLFDRARRPAGELDCLGHQHLALQIHLRHQRRKIRIAGRLHDRRVQIAVVDPVRIHIAVAQRGFADRLVVAKPCDLFVGDPFAGEPDGETLERRTQLVQIAHFVLGELTYEPALIRELHDQPIHLQPVQRLTNRRRTDVELFGDRVRTQLDARFDGAGDDAAPQRSIRARAELQTHRKRLEPELLRAPPPTT
jgi:hypothetical protein